MHKTYAGIGSRKTPLEFKQLINQIAIFLEQEGYILNSGGADGADSFFEENIKRKRIFLPSWKFNNHPSMLYTISKKAYEIGKKFHPNWDALSSFTKRLIARDSYQVLNADLETPVDFIVCWTENGEIVGGTGQALRIAKYYEIPVCNLYFYNSFEKFLGFYNFVKMKNK